MLSPLEIRERLHDRVTSVVSEKTGLHENTIRRLKTGEIKLPSYDTMKKISDYFEEQDEV